MRKEDVVSVVLPCYNESGNIVALIEAIHKTLDFCSHQIVVVDDNSPDGTFELVKSLDKDYVKPILRTADPSLAKSIRSGIEHADGTIVVVMDSDFNHQPSYIPQMVMNLQYYDCVSASRFVYGGKMDSRSRHLLSWIFNIYVRIITRKQVTDSLYGFWSIRKEFLAKLDFDKIFWGYGDYCIRLMYYLQKENASILQFPAVNGKRLAGQSHGKFISVFFQYARETLRLAFSNNKPK